MAKLIVVDETEGTRIPFLRGILTRSLQEAGIPFEDAYRLASELRDTLEEQGEVTRDALRERVVEVLAPYGNGVIRRYLGPPEAATIQVRFADGHETPFSRGRQRLGLESCGLLGEDALRVAEGIYQELLALGVSSIEAADLRSLTYDHILREVGEDAARRYLVWQAFQRSDRPLILIVGGAVGSGKSTVATHVAHRLQIVRIQSTDMLREVMRMMVPRRLMPVLHTSSFLAWRDLPSADGTSSQEAQLVDGYLSQSEMLSVPCQAVVRRAVQERVSLILEGIHVHAGLLADEVQTNDDAIVVRLTLAVLKPRSLKSRIRGRGKRAPGRRAKRYLAHFDEIWKLQSFMLSEADRLQVPIVPNEDLEVTIQGVMTLVLDELSRHLDATPAAVLGR